MEKVIYLGVFIAYFAVVRVLFIRMEEMSEKKRKRTERRLKCKTYETINYDNFNVEKGIYEN
jgi:hypothetical protein